MKTYKLNFTNTSDKLDFVLIDSKNEGEAIDLFVKESSNPKCMISIEDVTGRFVDFDGTIK